MRDESQHLDHDAPVRVILVGPAPPPESLRDARLDVVAARSSFDAIGEVGRPNGQSVVLVAANGPRGAEERIVRAVRRIDPDVPVIGMGDAWDGSCCDVHVSADINADGLLEILSRPKPAQRDRLDDLTPPPSDVTTEPAPVSDAAPDVETEDEPAVELPEPESRAPTPAPPRVSEGVALSPGDDLALVRALLAGADITDACLEMVRRRGGGDIEFIPGATAPDVGGSVVLAVRRREKCLGWLVSSEGHVDRLREEAAWLGAWLALSAQQSQLRNAAFKDAVTGAWNRRYFDRFLPSSIDDARGGRRSVSLLLFDIDNFKSYNDRYGHAAGDEILVETVKLLRSVVRPTDRVCRIGGDEFAVIFNEPEGPRNPPSEHPRDITDITERARRQIAEHRFPRLGTDAVGCLTISGGLATFPWDGHDGPSLMEHADRLTLESKAQGKNLICYGKVMGRREEADSGM